MSGLTTTQSRIAEDLDAFAEASWFTSSYLVNLTLCASIYSNKWLDSYVKFISNRCAISADIRAKELHISSGSVILSRRCNYFSGA